MMRATYGTVLTVFSLVQLMHFNCTAQNLLFAQRAGSDSNGAGENGSSLAIDLNGDVYMTGKVESGSAGAKFAEGQANETTLLINGAFLAKYDPNGELIWVQGISGATGYAVDTDNLGNVYVSGTFFTQATFGAGQVNETILSGQFGEIFYAKYDQDGILLWAKSAGGSGDDNPGGRGLMVSGGNFYLTGSFFGTVTFGLGEPNETTLIGESWDIFVGKFDSNGDLLWIRQAGGTNGDAARNITEDSFGNVYITGNYFDAVTFGQGLVNETVLNDANESAFIAKYSELGDFIWAISPFLSGTGDINGDVKVDGNSLVFTGAYFGTIILGSGTPQEIQLTGLGDDEMLVAKYDLSGSFLWARTARSDGGDRGQALAIDSQSNIYVTGYYGSEIGFGSGASLITLQHLGSFDVFIAKYSSQGDFIDAVTVCSSIDFEEGNDIEIDKLDNIYVTGYYRGSVTFENGGENQTSLNSNGFSEIFLSKYTSTDLSFTEVLNGTFTDIQFGSAVAPADYDNDGDYDLLISGWDGAGPLTQLYSNNGDGTFLLAPFNDFIDVLEGNIAWTDVNLDGFIDLVFSGNLTNQDFPNSMTVVYKNEGDGTFSEIYPNILTHFHHGSVDVGDYNNDGLNDLIFMGLQSSGEAGGFIINRLFKGDQVSGFVDTELSTITDFVIDGNISWLDFDNDGDIDYLISGLSGGTYVSRLHQNSNGSFSETLEGSFDGLFNSEIAISDANNDGYDDVLTIGLTNDFNTATTLYMNRGGSSFEKVNSSSLTNVWDGDVEWGDINNDGNTDFLAVGRLQDDSRAAKVYLGDGSGSFQQYLNDVIRTPTSVGNMLPFDYDGDGDLDIVLTGGGISVYENELNESNVAPSSPDNLSVSVLPTTIEFSWVAPSDDKTPSGGLSYDLYITDLSSGEMIVAAPADTVNGFRRIVEKGKIKTTFWTLRRTLTPGAYRVGVQAVDPGFIGGSFATKNFTVNSAPLLYLPFNGNANDESGNGRDGTPNGAMLTTDRFESSNQAYDFDGNDDLISINSDNLLGGSNEATISLFAKIERLNGVSQSLLGFQDFSLTIDINDQLNYQYLTAGGNTNVTLKSDLVADQWIHIVVRHTGSLTELFLDLEKKDERNIAGAIFQGNTNVNTIGAQDAAGFINFFDGQLDEILIFDRALSDLEISSLFSAGASSSGNNSPESISLSNTILPAGLGSGVKVGTFRTLDPDPGDSFTYAFIEALGSDNNSDFSIQGADLITKGLSTIGEKSIHVQTNDGTSTASSIFTVSIIDPQSETVLIQGSNISDYRIFSVPSTSAEVSTAFPGLMGQRADTWRVLSYDNSVGEYLELDGGSIMNAGKGYWHINSSNPTTMAPLVPTELNGNDEFVIRLDSGWNLIGNPFLANLDWTSVMLSTNNQAALQNVNLVGIYVYNGSYNLSTSLRVLEGGWVNTDAAVNLRLESPTKISSAFSGRVANPIPRESSNSGYESPSDWLLLLKLEDGSRVTNLSAIGMHPKANDGSDSFDLFAPPSISPSANFRIIDSNGLVRSFMSPGIEKKWELRVDAPSHSEVTVSWDSKVIEQIGQRMYLYLPNQNRTINMNAVEEVRIPGNTRIEIILGDKIDWSTLEIHEIAYPNPTEDDVTVEFLVDGNREFQEVKISFFSLDGNQVLTRKTLLPSGGMNRIVLEELNLVPGLYFYNVAYGEIQSNLKKLLIR